MSEQELWERYIVAKWGDHMLEHFPAPRWDSLHESDWYALLRMDTRYAELKILYV
jgi:hypothetical protein